MKKTIDLTEFWESGSKRHYEEHEEERRSVEAAINDFIKNATVIDCDGLALRGVSHIDVGPALELTYRNENGDVMAESSVNPFADSLILGSYDDGIDCIVTMQAEGDD